MVDVKCQYCGGVVPHYARASAKYCSERCSRKANQAGPGVNMWNTWKVRRKKVGLPVGERVTPSVADLVQRDGLGCHVCLDSIDYTLDWKHPYALTVDHIIPVSDPRSFHGLDNLKLAHRRCNALRGTRLHNDRRAA